MKINIGISNHHVHVTREVLDVLYGKNYELTVKRPLTQKGQFASEETVTLEKNGKTKEHIRIVGPIRKYTQIELLESDNEYFEINAPVRSSGDLEGSESITLIGPKGKIEVNDSTIVANRHIHMSQDDLINFNKTNKEIVKVKTSKGIVLNDVHIKSDDTCVLEMHINKDDAEKLGIEMGDSVEIC